mmetsp:Transcript_39730/g.89155  ORF Transcript_39730/g.89155 Transcript_39730/m.89155 type:complete len:140 (+) Transcript_39730:1815-2234(+)
MRTIVVYWRLVRRLSRAWTRRRRMLRPGLPTRGPLVRSLLDVLQRFPSCTRTRVWTPFPCLIPMTSAKIKFFLLVVPGNDGMPAVVFVWAGGSQPIQAHESLHEIGAQFVQGRGMLGAKIEVQHTGSEQDAFWDGFPNG